jgi:tight adherence protein B
MFDTGTLSMIIGIGVITLVAGLGLVMTRSTDQRAEDRLAGLTGARRRRPDKRDLAGGILARPSAIDLGRPSFWVRLVPNAENLNQLYEQADVRFPFKTFMFIVGGMALAGLVFGIVFSLPFYVVPLAAIFMGGLPFLWLLRRRAKRIREFFAAMPDAVDLIGRALRAGHGLAAGLNLVAEEMKGPIAVEFNRVYEEQNLGIPIELALRNMADRIPVMDVRFFVIAVIIQRATGGDLAEVLDKIGRLIRQRFELKGHVKALTAEGRLSGVVLLALPPALLLLITYLNYEYVSVLWTDPVGIRVLSVTAFAQLVGAWVIKKIVAIKV